MRASVFSGQQDEVFPTPKSLRSRATNPFAWAICVATVAVVAIIATNPSLLPSYISSDSAGVVHITENYIYLYDSERESRSYLNTARFFNLFLPISPNLVAFFIALFFIVVQYKGILDEFYALLAASFLLPAVILCLPFPQKDTICVLGLGVITLLQTMRVRAALLLICTIFVYVVISVIMRPYYIVALGGAGVVWVLWHGNQEVKIFVGGCLVIAVMLIFTGVFGDFYLEPQLHRDVVNLARATSSSEGHRTVLVNPLPPNSAINFIGNYIYALAYLNLPIIFFWDLRSLFMTCYMMILAVTVSNLLRCATKKLGKFFGLLFLMHLIVLPTFEPDLGSYLRHIAPLVAYLITGLKYEERKWGRGARYRLNLS